MVSKSIVLLALSATVAVASPFGHARFHRGTGMRGTGGHAYSTGGHGHFNESESGVASPSSGPRTFTVSPVPEASVSLDLEENTPSTAVAAAVSESTTTCLSTTTVYATSINYATVTAGPGRDVASVASTTVSLSIASPVNAAVQNFGSRSQGQGQGRASTTMATVVATSAQASAATSAAVSGLPAASSAAATASSGSGSISSAKKGLSYNTNSLLNLFSGSGASWSYNWGSSAGGSIPSGLEFVPMCWGKDQAPGCASAVLASGSSHMLSFNEPDLGSQSNIKVAEAVSLHAQYIATPLAGKVKIGSPAVTNGGTGLGLDYLGQFLSACGSGTATDKCKIDFLTIHWYDVAANTEYFKSHVTAAIALGAQYGIKKVWITEFAGTGTADAQASFMNEVIPWLELSAQSAVERYAYFFVGSSGGLGMVDGTALNAAGKVYAA